MEEIKENDLSEDYYNLYSQNRGLSCNEIGEDDYFKFELKDKTHELNLNQSVGCNKLLPFTSKNSFKKDDFEFISIIGRGSYAKVVKAKLTKDNTIYAIKIINRPFIDKVDS